LKRLAGFRALEKNVFPFAARSDEQNFRQTTVALPIVAPDGERLNIRKPCRRLSAILIVAARAVN
jgi:hypothetical protein